MNVISKAHELCLCIPPNYRANKENNSKTAARTKARISSQNSPKKAAYNKPQFTKIESGGQNHKSIAGSLKAKVNKRRGTGRGSCKHKAKAKNKHSAFENRETQKSPITRQAANEELPNRRK